MLGGIKRARTERTGRVWNPKVPLTCKSPTLRSNLKRWNQLSSACQKMVNGSGKSPITALLAITLRIGKLAGSMNRRYVFIPSKLT